MRQVRRGVFETNSSSTHSITICTQEEYEKFRNGELMYDSEEERLVPYSKALMENEESEWGYRRYRDHTNYGDSGGWWLDTYSHSFTSPSGDKLVAFGTFGRDG